jgi:hypothetical protein
MFAPVPATHAEHAGVLDWMSGVRDIVKGNHGIIDAAKGIEEATDSLTNWRGRSAGWIKVGFMTHFAGAQIVLALATTLAKGTKDERTTKLLSSGVSVGASCGGAIITTLAAPESLGATLVVAVPAWASCAKSAVELYTLWRDGKSLFDQSRGWQTVALTIDAAAFIGSAVGVGWKALTAAGRAAPTIWQSLIAPFQRGAGVSTLDKVGVWLEGIGVGLNGMKWIFDPAPPGKKSGPNVVTATPDGVFGRLERAGLRRPDCFFPWPLQTEGLLGPCPSLYDPDPLASTHGR